MAEEYSVDLSRESYVAYHIITKGNQDDILKLQILLEDFLGKYELVTPTPDYNSGKPLDMDYTDEIVCRLWTPGLSRIFIKGHEKDDDYGKRCFLYNNFARKGYPPKVEIAIASMFGADGGWCGYLEKLNSSIKLLDKDGEISKDVKTNITKREAERLIELLGKLDVKQSEGLYYND